MKSRYVVEVSDQPGCHLLYNTANGAFVELDDAAFDSWSQNACSSALESTLTQLGFHTSLSPEEELDRQRCLFDAERSDTKRLALSLIPTYACNFRCPYCYEKGHNDAKGKMHGRVMDAIMSFVQFKYEQDAFESLEIQWYGGDPSLALDEVAKLSKQLIAWADEHGVSYDAMMLTNANVIGEA